MRTRAQSVASSAGVDAGFWRRSRSWAIRCCLRSIVRRVDSVGCAVNTGSRLSERISSSMSSNDRPSPRSRQMQSAMPPGWATALSLRYSRRLRTR